jgi:hypothetical protein
MSIKDTLTNNSMNSFSFGGKTYTRRVDNNKVVYDISAGTDGSVFSTGWVNSGVDDGATLTFNHNLGTTDFVASAMVANDASGAGARILGEFHEDDGSVGFNLGFGYEIKEITNTTITLQLGKNGYYQMDSAGINAHNAAGGNPLSFSGQYIKVVLSAKMGSGSGTPAGSDRQFQFNDNGEFGANAYLTFDGSTAFIPRLAIGEGNVSGDEGGEIFLKHAVTNSTLAGTGVGIDIFQNKLRIYEYGPPYKGAYIDLTECAEHSAGMTNLLAGGSGGGGGVSGGSIGEISFFDRVSIADNTVADGIWHTASVNSIWAGASNLIVNAETVDLDTGGNSSVELKVRASAADPTEVIVIDHDGTSGQRSVMGEQAIIPLATDGTFQYYVTYGGNGRLRDFFVSGKIFKPEAPGNFSTGWVTSGVDDGATLTFNHNLGTTNLVASVMVADDASGAGARILGEFHEDDGAGGSNQGFGYELQGITNTSVTLQLGSHGYYKMDSSGINGTASNKVSFNGKYVKVILSAGGGASVTTGASAPALASDGDLWYDENSAALYVYTDSIGGWIQANGGGGGGGTGPRAYVAFDGTQQGNTNMTASIANSFNVSSVTDAGTGTYTVNFTTPVANPVPITAGMANHTINPIDTSILNVSSNSVQIIMGTNSAGKIDYPGVYLVVF